MSNNYKCNQLVERLALNSNPLNKTRFRLKSYGMMVLLSLFAVANSNAQTTLINPATDGGFNSGPSFAANGWTVASEGSGVVNWAVGTAVESGAITGNSAYVSLDNGVSNAYVGFSTGRTIYFYKDVVIPSGQTNIALSFDYKTAVSSWQVFVAPTTVIPVATDVATNSVSGSFPSVYPLDGATPVVLSSISTTTTSAMGFIPPSFAGQTVRVIFMWTNGSGGTNPPLAIDNISLVSRVGGQEISSVATGDYTNPSTWSLGYVPSPADDVVINADHTVTINSRMLGCENMYIAGANAIVQYGANSDEFAINNDLVINGSGARFNVYSGTTGKDLKVGHDISLGSGGRLDISVGSTGVGAGSLTLDGSAVQTISSDGTGFIGGTTATTTTSNAVDVINQLWITNTNSSTPNINWELNNVRIKSKLSLNKGRIALGTNKIIIGNFGNMSSSNFTCSNDSGFIGGTIGRWYGTGAAGTVINPGVDYNPNSAVLFPALSPTGEKRWAFLYSSLGSTAGELAITYTHANTMSTGLSILDGSTTITDRYDGSWAISNAGSGGTIYASVAGTLSLGLYANNAFVANDGNSRVLNAAAAATGTHVNGTTTPFVVRSGIALTDLITAPYYVGANASSVLGATTKTSAASGDWNTAATWSPSGVPTCSDVVTIASGHTVTNGSTSSASSVTIASGGTLVNTSSALTVGCTGNKSFFINNGTLTVSGGELKVNGGISHNAGSTFNQSGGDIIVDSNDNGNALTSVGQGGSSFKIETSSLNLTGGQITIVDPLVNNTLATSAVNGAPFDVTTLGATGTFQKFTNTLTTVGSTTIVMNGFNSIQTIYGIGQEISGTGIAPGTTITAITAGMISNQPITLTISQPTTAEIPLSTGINFSSMNNGSYVIDFPTTGNYINLAVGQGVTGVGIQPGTTIVAMGADVSGIGGVRLSQPVSGLPVSPITSPATVTFTTMTEGSTVIILDAINPAIVVGQTVGGIGIQPATTVVSINGLRLDISLPVVGTVVSPVTLSFYDGNLSSYAFSYNSTNHYAAGLGHTLQFGDGVSTEKAAVTTNGYLTNFVVGGGLFSAGNLKINALDGDNRFFNTVNALNVQNNFEITTGSVFKKTINTGFMYLGGNVTNNGTAFIHPNTNVRFSNSLNGVEEAATLAQTISGSGSFYNGLSIEAAYASFTTVTVNNSNASGVTVNMPDFRVQSITMVDGIIYTSAATPLYVGRADLSQNGIISGTNFGPTCHIDGPVVRGNALTFTSATFLMTPIGKDGQYSPISLGVTGGAMFRLEAFNTNAGSASANASNLSTKRWVATREGILGDLTAYKVRLGDSPLTAENIVLQATTDGGVYDVTTSASTFISGTPNTIETTSDLIGSTYTGYFAYGTEPNCTTVAPGNTIVDYSSTLVVHIQNSSNTGIVAGNASVTLQAAGNAIIVPGLLVSGNGIAPGTTVVSVTGTALVLSQPALTSSTAQTPLTFYTVTSSTSLCGSQSVTLSLQNSAVGNGVTYQWQSSADGVTYTDIADAMDEKLTVTPTEETYYQCVVTCPFGPVTATSTPVLIEFSNELTDVTEGSSCTPDTPIALEASASTGTINWYADQVGGEPIATGATYTPSPAVTTTYYVASEEIGTPYTAGRAFSGTATQAANFSGLVFNANKSMILNSVKVHPKQTAAAADAGAPITIALYNSQGTIVDGTTPVTFTPSTNTGAAPLAAISDIVVLNYSIPAGMGYKLLVISGLSTTNTLGRVTAANNIPVGVGSLGITGGASTFNGVPDTFYYNFFDISVTDVCSTPRVAVVATVNTAPDAPTGDAVQVFNVATAPDATIEDLVVTNSNGFWYPTSDDAIAGTNAFAAGTVLVNGTTYYTVNESNGCVSASFAVTVTVTLGVNDLELTSLSYYPNPVVSNLTISSQEIITAVEVYNMLGQVVLKITPNVLTVDVDFQGLSNAMYLVKVQSNEASKTLRILKK